jgi:hypothetical protein
LSAAEFELGQYENSVWTCNAALALIGDSPEHNATRQKLTLRKAKACLYDKRFEEGFAAADPLSPGDEKNALQRTFAKYQDDNVAVLEPQRLKQS